MKKFYPGILILIFFATAINAQDRADTQWQYEQYPPLPFLLEEVQLDLSIEPASALIKGAGRYQVSARQPVLTQVVFNTADIEIQTVFISEQEIDFRVSGDSLIMPLPDTLKLNDSAELLITWQSSSPYGIHTDVYGNLWTSLNPKARRHWMPLPDHPRVETRVEATLTIPAEKQAVMNGEFVDDEIISANQKTVRWASEAPIPVTGISLAVGNFQQDNARSGVHKVSIYAGENVLLEEVRSGLLRQAVATLKKYQDKLSFEYPYETLNIVVLPDHRWEEIHSGAGIIYLYQNLGSLPAQLKRGIAGQWLGSYHRYTDAPNPKYELLKILLSGYSNSNLISNPDSLLSVGAWNAWQQDAESTENSFLKETMANSIPELIQAYEGVTSWNQYAEFWYDETGIFWEQLPLPNTAAGRYQAESGFIYDVYYNYNEANSNLMLVFVAKNDAIETLAGLELIEYGFSDISRVEISFTGIIDSVYVQLSPGVEFVTIGERQDKDIELMEHKPLMFLINQLRSSNPSERVQAAIQLKEHADEPDLQLALRDVLRTEENEKVRAALYGTLSDITGGDSGTEQTFLNLVNSDDEAIRVTAIRALANYPGNESASSVVRNILRSSTSDTVFKASLNTYQAIASPEDLLSVVNQLEQNEQNDRKAIQILKSVSSRDTTGQALNLADQYIQGRYPYAIRNTALKLLIAHQQQADYWMQELEPLLADRDPRIRFLALDALKNLSEDEAAGLLEVRAKEEFDSRILKKIEMFRW